MDLFEPESPQGREAKGMAELHEAYGSLRTLFHCLAIAMLILTGTFFIYLYREVVVVRRQSREITRIVNDFDRSNSKTAIRDFQSKLYHYAQQYPDFRPIYIKYYGSNTVSSAVTRPIGTNVGGTNLNTVAQ